VYNSGMSLMTRRHLRARRARRLWWFVLPLIPLYIASGFGRIGCGWSGTSMLQLAHGGLFYVTTPEPDFLRGPFARLDRYFLDYLFSLNTEPDNTTYIYLPLWPVLTLAILAAAFTTYRALRRRVSDCQSCGYDLKGITGPCPECGSPS
jgi:hypothetical protein